MEAWNQPKFVCIERDPAESYESMQKVPWCWHPSAAKYSFALLEKAREEFFEKYQQPLLKIQYETLRSEPVGVLSELCKFLQHIPTSGQLRNALKLIEEAHDDCVFPENVE